MDTEEAYERAATDDGWRVVGAEMDRCLVFEHADGRRNYNVTWGELCDEQGIEPSILESAQ